MCCAISIEINVFHLSGLLGCFEEYTMGRAGGRIGSRVGWAARLCVLEIRFACEGTLGGVFFCLVFGVVLMLVLDEI